MRNVFRNVMYRAFPASRRLRYLTYLSSLREWRSKYGGSYPVFCDRLSLYRHINVAFLAGVAIDFIEFGVYQSDSVIEWTKLNRHVESRFVGFDTFTGLPETWHKFSAVIPAGTFDAAGQKLNVPDSRVTFVKGLFQ